MLADPDTLPRQNHLLTHPRCVIFLSVPYPHSLGPSTVTSHQFIIHSSINRVTSLSTGNCEAFAILAKLPSHLQKIPRRARALTQPALSPQKENYPRNFLYLTLPLAKPESSRHYAFQNGDADVEGGCGQDAQSRPEECGEPLWDVEW